MTPNTPAKSQVPENRATASVAGAYALANIENAPPLKLVRLLYQGAIRFLDNAVACDPGTPDSRFDHWLSRADDIVVELRLALDRAPAPQVAESLTDLYLFVEKELARARRERSVEPIAGARSVLVTLLGAWSAVDGGRA
jgi:flagellar protein FliS